MGLNDIKLTDIDFQSVEACTQPRILRTYIALLEEDGGYFHQLLHAARQKLASLTGRKSSSGAKGIAGGVSAAEIAAARQDLLAWQRSLESSSELTFSNDCQNRSSNNNVKSIKDATEELEELPRDAEAAFGTIEDPRDGEKWEGKRKRTPVLNSSKETGRKTGKQDAWGRWGRNKGGRERETLDDTEGEKKIGNGAENRNTSGDTQKRREGEKDATEELEKDNNDGREPPVEGTSPHGLAKGSSNTLEARLVEGKNQQHLTRITETEKQTESPSSGETATGMQRGERDERPAEKEKPMSLSTSKLTAGVGNHTITAATVDVTERIQIGQGSRESHTKSDARKHQNNEFRPHSLERQMRKICVQLDADEDTDECSDIPGSEDD